MIVHRKVSNFIKIVVAFVVAVVVVVVVFVMAVVVNVNVAFSFSVRLYISENPGFCDFFIFF